MAAAALLVSGISLISLYRVAIDQHSLRLVETVKSQARLIEAIAQFENLDDVDRSPESVLQATLEKLQAEKAALEEAAKEAPVPQKE